MIKLAGCEEFTLTDTEGDYVTWKNGILSVYWGGDLWADLFGGFLGYEGNRLSWVAQDGKKNQIVLYELDDRSTKDYRALHSDAARLGWKDDEEKREPMDELSVALEICGPYDWYLLVSRNQAEDWRRILNALPFHHRVSGCAKAMAFGAEKYDWDNWSQVLEGEKRYKNAALRHLLFPLYYGGKTHDEESGLHHWDHAAACLQFVLYFMGDR